MRAIAVVYQHEVVGGVKMSWEDLDGSVPAAIFAALAVALLAIWLVGCVTIPITVGDTAGGSVTVHTEILKDTRLGQ